MNDHDSAAQRALPELNRTVHELTEQERDKAVQAFTSGIGSPPDFGFAPDRAWIEGFCAARESQPAGEGLTDEREQFVRHIQATEQRMPLLWLQVWANSMQKDPAPVHLAGKYFMREDQKAWQAWQARSALAAAPKADATQGKHNNAEIHFKGVRFNIGPDGDDLSVVCSTGANLACEKVSRNSIRISMKAAERGSAEPVALFDRRKLLCRVINHAVQSGVVDEDEAVFLASTRHDSAPARDGSEPVLRAAVSEFIDVYEGPPGQARHALCRLALESMKAALAARASAGRAG